jgi:hypothetical protein
MRRPDWSRDPIVPSLGLFAAIVIAGFVGIGLGWRVVARTLVVPYQLPAVVSGAMGGFALIALGAGLATIQTGRRLAAQERAETEDVLDEASALVEALKGRQR